MGITFPIACTNAESTGPALSKPSLNDSDPDGLWGTDGDDKDCELGSAQNPEAWEAA